MRPASRLLPPRLGAFFETARPETGRGNEETRQRARGGTSLRKGMHAPKQLNRPLSVDDAARERKETAPPSARPPLPLIQRCEEMRTPVNLLPPARD